MSALYARNAKSYISLSRSSLPNCPYLSRIYIYVCVCMYVCVCRSKTIPLMISMLLDMLSLPLSK